MARFVLIATLDDVELVVAAVAAPEPAIAAKSDVAVEFIGVDPEGHFSFAIPAYDPASFHTLTAIHVSLFEKLADGSASMIPSDPAEIVKAALHFSTDTTSVQASVVVVDATEAPEGRYSAALVAEFLD
jgi:hypothetical protein